MIGGFIDGVDPNKEKGGSSHVELFLKDQNGHIAIDADQILTSHRGPREGVQFQLGGKEVAWFVWSEIRGWRVVDSHA